MSDFIPSKKTAQDFNDGQKYVGYNPTTKEYGDDVEVEAINDLIESALYTQNAVEEGVQEATDIANEGIASVTEIANNGVATATSIANSAKQTAEGALSEVNQVLADKTLLPDVQKNYYNLGAFDTFVSNGDGTGTVTRKTGEREYHSNDIQNFDTWDGLPVALIPKPLDFVGYGNYTSYITPNNKGYNSGSVADAPNTILSRGNALAFGVLFAVGTSQDAMREAIEGLVIQYEFATQYQFTEQVIENQPIRHLNQEGENWLDIEFKKGLNLCPYDTIKIPSNVSISTYKVGDFFLLKAGVYRFKISTTSTAILAQYIFDTDGTLLINHTIGNNSQLILEEDTRIQIGVYVGDGGAGATCQVMLTRGTIPYPYIPYNGRLIHEKDISNIQIFPKGVDPADTIGGDWIALGTIATDDGVDFFDVYERV